MQKGGRRPRRAGALSAFFFVVPILCLPVQARADDGHVEQGAGSNFKPDPKVLSAPILQHPIYGCADTVVVMGFVPHAELQIFVDGDAHAEWRRSRRHRSERASREGLDPFHDRANGHG